uniref:NADH dehydrogenase subunit 6 n=1 Tax=Ornithodoros noorsveldensis TaxID=1580573 RepID=UPI000738F78E|nr:NADH dehydrogenase subunit 6 [Ornithodoros noorsveldensis]AIZ58708.1 NADH dehydrogenase subunit 6 [Ornithodoros noorsveldensis]AIZ58721.1 NADH dehydrogenase subunit 6 [Ornithodoros noorsveldensis]UYB78493.1 NADH dehydrogenase subunit 6 [Ornithodoros noorsveldensis]
MKMLMMISIWFIASTHPISMIMILISSTLLFNLFIYIQLKNTWFPLLVTLLILGGMLTIFLYITSLTPNKKFTFNKFFMMISILGLTIEVKNNIFTNFEQNNIFSMFNTSSIMMIIFMTIYLLITLIAIMMMIKSSMAPMKSMN